MKYKLRVKSLPYREDSTQLFQAIAHLPNAVFLDSTYPHGTQGRFDILAAAPHTFIVHDKQTTEVWCHGEVTTHKGGNPLDLVRRYLKPIPASQAYPFLGGGIGYFAYDLGRHFEVLPDMARNNDMLPQMVLGMYDWAVIVDHATRHTSLIGVHSAEQSPPAWEEVCDLLLPEYSGAQSAQAFQAAGELNSNMSKPEYLQKFEQIMRYIHAGDCYQVNLAQKFSIPVAGDPFQAYCCLRKLAAAPYSAFLNFTAPGSFPDFQILSSSPERFLQVRARHVVTKPIKGTRRRLSDAILDQYQIDQLRSSVKDRAENLMIVDLIRNDISKNCRLASVHVSELFKVESFTNVHHLVSTIEGELCKDKDALDLLQGCFPGGSITGAPKLRAMEIIEELEPDRRNVYCGSIGYISNHGDMDLNIAIRTAVHCEGKLNFYAGGGIVSDSNGENEYQETLDKVSLFFRLLGLKSLSPKIKP